jgi:hypothetical protein
MAERLAAVLDVSTEALGLKAKTTKGWMDRAGGDRDPAVATVGGCLIDGDGLAGRTSAGAHLPRGRARHRVRERLSFVPSDIAVC